MAGEKPTTDPEVPENSLPRFTAAMNWTLYGMGRNEFVMGLNTWLIGDSTTIMAPANSNAPSNPSRSFLWPDTWLPILI